MARGSASIFMADVANQVLEPIMTRTELLIPVIVSCIDTVTTSATTRQQMFDVEYEVLQSSDVLVYIFAAASCDRALEYFRVTRAFAMSPFELADEMW